MTLPCTPWRKVVSLRDDLRTGELSLAVFAANGMRERKAVRHDPPIETDQFQELPVG